MMKKRNTIIVTLCLVLVSFLGFKISKKYNFNKRYTIGQPIDSLNGVIVYYNGGVDHVSERNTQDGYNLGLQYQCVEFVKRYYYEFLHHKMPDSYGHAKDFFDKSLKSGTLNSKRGLVQYTNPGNTKPQVSDLVVLSGTFFNRYGHVAIISKVTDHNIEIIQQNPGPYGRSRETYLLEQKDNTWRIKNDRIMGWLRKE